MNRKVMGLLSCLVAVCAVSAVVSAIASAITLPTFSAPAGTKFTGTNGPTKLEIEGGARVSCTSGTTDGELASSKKQGTFLVKFVECGEERCRSLGAVEVIVMTGEWHLVSIVVKGQEVHLGLFELPPQGLHIECPQEAVKLILIKGAFVVVIEAPAKEKTKVFTVKAVAKEGVQEFSEFENDSGAKVNVSLKASQEGGKAKTTGVNGEGTIEFESATEIEN